MSASTASPHVMQHDPDADAAAEKQLLAILKKIVDPGDNVLLDQWAEQKIILGRVSRYSGPLKLDRTPYMRGVLRAYTHPRYGRIFLCWAAQTGKTLVIQITLAYDIDQDPGSCMVVYPDQNTGKRRSRKHLRPLIEDCPILRRHMTGKADDMQTYEYALDRMTINIAWAGSASVLASEPIRYLKRDEIAKFKHMDKTEAHPIELSARRVISYGHLAKILDATTPGLADAIGDKDLKNSTWHQYWVPCPHCGKPDQVRDVPDPVIDPRLYVKNGNTMSQEVAREVLAERLTAAGYQVLEWRFVKWETPAQPKEGSTAVPLDVEKIARTAYYRCPLCGGRIEHRQVHKMTLQGKWVPKNPDRSTFGAQLPSWYRSLESTTFEEVCKRWLLAQGDPKMLQDVINGDFAEGYRETGSEKTVDEIRAHCRGYAPNTLPWTPLFIFLTVDVRDPELHIIIRAWREYETSALLRYAVLPRVSKLRAGETPDGHTLAIIDQIQRLTFRAPNGQLYGINLTGIDSGDDTDEVYAFCRSRAATVAMKGEENMRQVISYSRPQKAAGSTEADPDSCWLISFQANYFTDAVFNSMLIPPGMPGEWMLPSEVGDDYIDHLRSEKKVTVKNRWGYARKRYQLFGQANHWLDGEKMQKALARFAEVHDMDPPEQTAPTVDHEPKPQELMGRDVSKFQSRFRR